MRTAAVLGAAAALTVGLAAPAHASSQVADVSNTFNRFASAEFGWATADHVSYTRIDASTSPTGTGGLSVLQIDFDVDASGNVGRTVITDGFVTAGYVEKVDTARYSAASLDAVAVPVEQCLYVDENDPGTCGAAGTVELHLRWTGSGPITRTAGGSSSHDPGFYNVFVSHQSATLRDAAATGTITGLPEAIGDAQSASIGRQVDGRVFVCGPHLCPASG